MAGAKEVENGAEGPIMRTPGQEHRLIVPGYLELYDEVRSHASAVASDEKRRGATLEHFEATGYGWLVRRVMLAYLKLSDGDRGIMLRIGKELDETLRRLPEGTGCDLEELLERFADDIIMPPGDCNGRGAGGVAQPKRKGKPKGPEQSVAAGRRTNHGPIRIG